MFLAQVQLSTKLGQSDAMVSGIIARPIGEGMIPAEAMQMIPDLHNNRWPLVIGGLAVAGTIAYFALLK